jgi:hypothetical protein
VKLADIKDAIEGIRGMCHMSIVNGDGTHRGYLEIAVSLSEEMQRVRFFELFEFEDGAWRIIGEGADFTDAVELVLGLKQRVEAHAAAERLGHQP